MARSPEALVTADVLAWARASAGLPLERAAERIGVSADRLTAWEKGELRPTIKQLRSAASVYRQPFAAFFLPAAPAPFEPPVHDYRRASGASVLGVSPELRQDLRLALDRRAILLELVAEEQTPGLLSLDVTVEGDPEAIGSRIREMLGITRDRQRSWSDRDGRGAFNGWREAIEQQHILVFQATEVRLEEMRGYSVADLPLPVIVVNRKDTYTGRTFSMLHELSHILLRSSGLCDLDVGSDRPPEEQRIEVFCNHIAGAALVPSGPLLSNPVVASHSGSEWSEEELRALGQSFGVSREVVLRRLLILGKTTDEFYEERRQVYLSQYQDRPGEGFVPPSTNVLSAAGKPYTRAVLDAFNDERITSSDACDYLGIRLKHFPAVAQALGTE